MSKSTRPSPEVNGRPPASANGAERQPLEMFCPATAAMYYDGLGWVTVPICHPQHRGSHPSNHAATCERPGKQPTRKIKPLLTTRFTPEQLRGIWKRNGLLNVGVLTGRCSKIVMVDCDSPEALEAYEAFAGAEQGRTWSFYGGRPWPHFVYAWPYDWAPSAPALKQVHPKLDFLGEGLLSVMPPSLHKSGMRYRWTVGGPGSDVPLAECPGPLLDMLRATHYDNRPRGGVVSAPAPRLDARELGRPAAYAEQCHPAVSGAGGRAQTFKVACKMVHGFGLSVHDAHRVLLAHWNGRCEPPWTDEELLKEIEGAKERGHAPRIEERHFAHAGAAQLVPQLPAIAEPLPGRSGSTLKDRTLEFVLDPYVAKANITLIVGASNTGKSTFLAHLVNNSRRTVYLPGYEEDPDLCLLPRLRANGVDVRKLHLLDSGNWKMPTARDKLLKVMKQFDADLLLVDPLSSYIPEGGSENHPECVREMLEAFGTVAQESNSAVVGVRHPGKDKDNLMRGAGSWREVPRTVLELMFDKGPPPRHLIRWEKDGFNRGGGPREYRLVGAPKQPKSFVLGEYVGQHHADLMREVPDQLERLKIDQAVDLLRALLGDGRKDAKFVFTACEVERLSERTVRNAARQLGVCIKREGQGNDHKSYWSLPPA